MYCLKPVGLKVSCLQLNYSVVYFRKLESVAKPSVMVVLRCCTNAKLRWKHGYHGNRGRLRSCLNDTISHYIAPPVVEANLNDTMKLADVENLHFGIRIWDISPNIRVRSVCNITGKFRNLSVGISSHHYSSYSSDALA